MGRAKRAIEALAELAPRIARVRRDGQETEWAVEKLIVGDIVIVKPDERIAADGFVIKGESSVDQSRLLAKAFPLTSSLSQTASRLPPNPNPLHR